MSSLKKFFVKDTYSPGRIFLAVALGAGVYLRCWHWSSQLLLDDEWHALNFVLTRSFTDVLVQQGMGANSIPINIWTWLLLHTTGWSEALLKLPSLVCGIASLVIIPWLVKRLWGEGVATVTAALLAVSPVLIFYSRLTRPYAPTMLLATVSLLLTIKWIQDGQRRDILLSAVSGSLAISFHLYAAIPVCAPLLVATFCCLKGRTGVRDAFMQVNALKFTDLLMAFGIFALVDGLLVVLPNLLNPWWKGVQGMDHATVQTALTVMTLLAGSRSLLLGSVAAILLVAGLGMLIRNCRSTGMAFSLPFLIFLCVAATTTQDGSHAGIQVARYGISFFPLAFIAIAVAVVQCGEIIRLRVGPACAVYALPLAGVTVWIPFLVTNPLWQIYTYTSPNNFTNHSCYQYRYEPIQWETASPERDLVPGLNVPYAAIPRFYFNGEMLSAAQGLIESPLMVGDQLNVYYYYQHFHALPVVAGFNSSVQIQENASNREYVYAESPVEYVLSSVPVELRSRSTWRTMVDLNDPELLKKRYTGWLVAVHLNPEREVRRDGAPDQPFATMTSEDMRKNFGDPVFEDGNMLVWKIE